MPYGNDCGGGGGGGGGITAVTFKSLDSRTVVSSTITGTNAELMIDTTKIGGGVSAVNSVFGRSGNVTAQTDDYQFNQIGGKIASSQLIPATTTSLGGVIVGSGLTVDASGKLTVTGSAYVLPVASQFTLGGIKVGNNLSIGGDGTLSATATPYTLPDPQPSPPSAA